MIRKNENNIYNYEKQELIIYNSQNMITVSLASILATVAIVMVTYFVYVSLVRPYRLYLFYKKIISSAYKTYIYPFSFKGMGLLKLAKSNLQQYGDSLYTIKTIYPQYQVAFSSITDTVLIDLIDPDLIKEFYQKQMQGYYVKSENMAMMVSLKQIVGPGLLFSEGEEWKLKKKIMSNVFNYDFIKSKIAIFTEIGLQKISEVENTDDNKDKSVVKIDVNNLLQRIFGNVVVKCFFGDIEIDKLDGQEIFAFANDLFEKNVLRVRSFFAFLIGPNFTRYNLRTIDRQVSQKAKNFNLFAEEIIHSQIKKIEDAKNSGKTNQQNGKYKGVIDLLISQNKLRKSQQKSSTEKKQYYTVQDLVSQFKTFFFAGTDTTSNATTMLIYLLAQNPKIEQKLRDEIESVFPNKIKVEDVTYQNLKRLQYFDNVFKETLRMNSPTAGIFFRQAIKDHYIGSIPIKKGVMVAIKIKSNHFKQQFYDNPQEFNPDRWSLHDPTKINPFSYFPFSSGQRNCIGQHLAQLESKIAVILILKQYKKITLEKPEFRKYMRTLYGAQHMITTFQKRDS